MKAGSHNDLKPCVTSCWVRTSIYQHSACTTHQHDVSRCKDRIDFYLNVPSNALSQSNFNNYVFYGRRETYWGCLLFSLLVASLKQSYKDTKAKEKTWKEVGSQVTEQTTNRNNMLLSWYFELYYQDLLKPLSKYRTHPHFSLFLLPSLLSVKQSKQQHFSLHDEGGV